MAANEDKKNDRLMTEMIECSAKVSTTIFPVFASFGAQDARKMLKLGIALQVAVYELGASKAIWIESDVENRLRTAANAELANLSEVLISMQKHKLRTIRTLRREALDCKRLALASQSSPVFMRLYRYKIVH